MFEFCRNFKNQSYVDGVNICKMAKSEEVSDGITVRFSLSSGDRTNAHNRPISGIKIRSNITRCDQSLKFETVSWESQDGTNQNSVLFLYM